MATVDLELRSLIAETLAAHTIMIIDKPNRARAMRCICADWSAPSDLHLGLDDAEHRLHRADAAVAVVAEWLRAEAVERLELADQPNGYTAAWEDAITDLADALTQKEPDSDG